MDTTNKENTMDLDNTDKLDTCRTHRLLQDDGNTRAVLLVGTRRGILAFEMVAVSADRYVRRFTHHYGIAAEWAKELDN